MPLPRRHLHDGEEIVIERRPHPVQLVMPALAVLVAFVVAVFVATSLNPRSGGTNGYITWFSLLLVVGAVVWFVQRWLVWSRTSFVVTTDRLIYRSGVVSKHGKEIPLERINDISFHQSIIERLVGAGDLTIESGGTEGQQHFSDVYRPADMQHEIYAQIERSQARDQDRAAGRHELSVPEQIDKLDDLRRRGVITQADFDTKKAQLLDKM